LRAGKRSSAGLKPGAGWRVLDRFDESHQVGEILGRQSLFQPFGHELQARRCEGLDLSAGDDLGDPKGALERQGGG